MEASAQLNARMSRELKSAGDKRLAEAGISPTKLIRLVWEKAASGSEGLRQLLAVLQSNEAFSHTPSQTDERTYTGAPTAQGERLFAEGLTQLGINQAATCTPETANWKDLRKEAIALRLKNRGIL